MIVERVVDRVRRPPPPSPAKLPETLPPEMFLNCPTAPDWGPMGAGGIGAMRREALERPGRNT